MSTVPDNLDDDVLAILLASSAGGSHKMSEIGVVALREMVDGAPHAAAPGMREVVDTSFAGPHGAVPVRIYRPEGPTGPASPAIVYFHGGGMIIGSIAASDSTARHLAAESQAVVISVGYRLAPEHPYPVANDEAYAALEWAHAQAAELRVAAELIAVAGDSAGGSLAAAVALRSRNEGGPAVFAQLLIYPGLERLGDRPSIREYAGGPVNTVEDVRWMKELYLGPDVGADTEYGTPAIAKDLRGLPPAIVVTAEADLSRDSVEDYGHRLRAAGVQVSLLRYPGVYHGFMSQPGRTRRGRLAAKEIGALLRAKFTAAQEPA